MREHGFDITRTSESYLRLMHYISQTHNCFGLGSASGQSDGLGSRRSPIELVVQKERPAPTCSMFGSVVHAKVPDSIAALVPEVTRFVPAAYLHLRQNSLAHMVSSKIGSDIRIFQAEVKPLSQLVWDPSLAPDIIKAVEREGFQIASPDPPMDLRAQDDKVGISESLPMNGPPRAWIREHGPTVNCSACNSSSRHGRKHSATCCRRYRDWVDAERKKMSESLPKEIEGQTNEKNREKEEERTSPPVEPHPTGRIRYHEKSPPVVHAPGSEVKPSSSESVPNESQDHDMAEYEPTDPGNDIPMPEDLDAVDPESLPIDISSLVYRLTRPPEHLIRSQHNSGVIAPLFIPTKDSGPLTSEGFRFCGEKVYLINPLSGLSEDGLVRS